MLRDKALSVASSSAKSVCAPINKASCAQWVQASRRGALMYAPV